MAREGLYFFSLGLDRRRWGSNTPLLYYKSLWLSGRTKETAQTHIPCFFRLFLFSSHDTTRYNVQKWLQITLRISVTFTNIYKLSDKTGIPFNSSPKYNASITCADNEVVQCKSQKRETIIIITRQHWIQCMTFTVETNAMRLQSRLDRQRCACSRGWALWCAVAARRTDTQTRSVSREGIVVLRAP